jgi:hypothetical protein
MLPANEVLHPYMADVLPTVPPKQGVDDSDRITHMINHVPDSELGTCPKSDDEVGNDLDLTGESDWVRIISDADPLDDTTWIRRKQGNFSFMDQDTYGDLPTLLDDVDVHVKEYSLHWEEEGKVPKPTVKMKDTPKCLRKGHEKKLCAPVIAMMVMLPLLFWKISVGQSNNVAHQKINGQGKRKGEPIECNIWCQVVRRHHYW